MSRRSVFCIASSRGRADRIVNDLKAAGFESTELSVLFHGRNAIVRRPTPDETSPVPDPIPVPSKGDIRGVMAWIDGIRTVSIPGVAPLIAAGPIAASLGGATVGGLSGGLINFGVPEVEAMRYERGIHDGHTLVSVHTTSADKGDQARELFTAAGAEDVFTIVDITPPKASLLDAHGLSRPRAA